MTQHSESCDAILLSLYAACCPCCCGILIASPEKLWPSASRGTLQIMAGTTWQTGLMLHAITPPLPFPLYSLTSQMDASRAHPIPIWKDYPTLSLSVVNRGLHLRTCVSMEHRTLFWRNRWSAGSHDYPANCRSL